MDEDLVGTWVETSVPELRTCGPFDDEQSALWRAAPAFALGVRDSDPDRGATILEGRSRTAGSEGGGELVAATAFVGAAVLQAAELVVLAELHDRALIWGQRAGWTAALLLLRESMWLRAVPHTLADELELQSRFLSSAGPVRLGATSTTGDEWMVVAEGDRLLHGRPGEQPSAYAVSQEERGAFLRGWLLDTAPAEAELPT
jgi:hypothetical protein